MVHVLSNMPNVATSSCWFCKQRQRNPKRPVYKGDFCRAQVRQVSNIFETPELNPCDIAATNRTENQTWFTRTMLKLQLKRDKNCIELPRQKSPV